MRSLRSWMRWLSALIEGIQMTVDLSNAVKREVARRSLGSFTANSVSEQHLATHHMLTWCDC